MSAIPSTRGPKFVRTRTTTGAPAAPLVLVVDDHADSRLIARLVLESVGFRVAEAESGGEALRVAASLRPAAVLLDLVLPGLDGWQVARYLRDGEGGHDVVVIAVTAVGQREEHERALSAGCDAVITKPASPRVVLAALGDRLGFPMPASAR
ncbi:MAG TPA: response regulator [Gemmatimonadaceae bacterium]|jgi:CheY-like chemotaxis protein|nr:response regulator [Gemmatimonadaceae bacterium]